MKILMVLKRYNKIFAIIILGIFLGVFLVIGLSGNYLKGLIYHDDIKEQPVNSIKGMVVNNTPIDDDDNNNNNNNNGNNSKKLTYMVDGEIFLEEKISSPRVTKLPTPTKKGYIFKYWVYNGKEFKVNDVIQKDMVLSAVFEKEDNPDDDIDFEYVFTKDKSVGDYIYLVDQFPIKDEVGKILQGKYKTFDFKLNLNQAAKGIKYQITLEKMEGTDLKEEWIKAYLTKEGIDVPNCLRSNGRIKTFNEYNKYNGNPDEIILTTGTITEEEANRGYIDYTFRMWVSEDVTNIDNTYNDKSFIARVNVYANGSV